MLLIFSHSALESPEPTPDRRVEHTKIVVTPVVGPRILRHRLAKQDANLPTHLQLVRPVGLLRPLVDHTLKLLAVYQPHLRIGSIKLRLPLLQHPRKRYPVEPVHPNQSDDLGYTVPPVTDMPYMDRCALEDRALQNKLKAIEELGRSTWRSPGFRLCCRRCRHTDRPLDSGHLN